MADLGRALEHLFGAWFHPDCMLDDSSSSSIVSKYVLAYDKNEILRAQSELDVLCAECKHLSEGEVRRKLLGLGAGYIGGKEGFTPYAWLTHISKQVKL